MNTLKIFVVSDSVGETAQKVITAVLAQFPDLDQVEIEKFPFVDSSETLMPILRDALQEKAVVVTTLVEKEMNQICHDFSKKTGLTVIDYMSELMKVIELKTQLTPAYERGLIRHLDQQYFDRVEAIDFAVHYDDGKDARGFDKADLVILGISRTSKTPVSMYLANKSIKVANLPIIPEVKIPQEIYEIDAKKIVGLTADADYIWNIRQSRLHSLGLSGETSYVDKKRIEEELKVANDLYQLLGAHVVNVKNKSIEEISQEIEGLLTKI